MQSPPPPQAGGSPIPKAAWIAMGTIGALIVVLLAAVLYKLSVPGTAPSVAASAAGAQASPQAAAPGASGSATTRPSAQSAVAVTGTLPARQPSAFPPLQGGAVPTAPRDSGRNQTAAGAPPRSFEPQTFTPQAPAVPAAPTAPVCADCGTALAVTPVQEQGQANGVGAVVGGLVGGLLGNQIGGGNGRTAATVIGAVGGGLAGNEVQKHIDAKTVYRVRIRMDDGATRDITLSSAPPLGQRVRVQANGSVSPM